MKTCKRCNTPFKPTVPHQKYCSSKCRGLSNQELICKQCGVKFYPPRFNKNPQYCSAKCRGITGFLIPRTTMEIKCKTCGKIFKHETTCRNPKKLYCSGHCKYKAAKHRVIVAKPFSLVCEQCGKEFQVFQRYKKRFCSPTCGYAHRKDKQTIKGKNGNGVLAFLRRRNLVEKCSECGYDAHPEILGVHHADSNRTNNSFKNLIVLCPNCHALKHGRHLTRHPYNCAGHRTLSKSGA